MLTASLSIATTANWLDLPKIIHAANDAEAIAQAEVVRGSLAAELLDVEGLRIVKYLPGNGGAPS